MVTEAWRQLRDYRFRPATHFHPAEEIALQEHGLYSLDGYLSYWALHNATVLRKVPSERLLVARTDEIKKRVLDICKFANIPEASANRERSHSFSACRNSTFWTPYQALTFTQKSGNIAAA